MKNNHGNNQSNNQNKRNQKARKHYARKPRHRSHAVLLKRTALGGSNIVNQARSAKIHLPLKKKSAGNLLPAFKDFSVREIWESSGEKAKEKTDETIKNQKIESIDSIHKEQALTDSKSIAKKPVTKGGGQATDLRSSVRWYDNPRITGAVAAVLLFAMLVAAIIPTNLNVQAEEQTETSALNPTMQLAKEYIYAGSRMLAIEDYGLNSSSTPTPTPTLTPTPTITPTPTPTPVIASCPTGYSSLGGLILGNPTATVFNNSLFVFVRGGDNAIYYRKTADGSNFDNYVGLGGYLISDPATLVTYNALYIEAIGGDNDCYYRVTTDGVNFAEWVGGTVSAQTTQAAYFNGNTYTFIKGDGTQPPLCYKVEAGGTPTPTPAPPTPTPTPAPAVPSIASVTPNADPTCLDITLNGVSGADSYNVKILNSGYTINVTQLSFPWCGLAPSTYYEYQAQAVNQYGTSGWSATVGGTTANPPPTPTPTPTPNNYSPVGYLESADGSVQLITGWSYDPDNPSASNQVHIYIDGPAGSGTGFAINADQPRPDVNSTNNISGNHGFSFTIPSQYLDGQQHSVYAYGIDTGANNPAVLNNSPLYFQYPPPTPTPCHSIPQDVMACEQGGGTWNYETCQCITGRK